MQSYKCQHKFNYIDVKLLLLPSSVHLNGSPITKGRNIIIPKYTLNINLCYVVPAQSVQTKCYMTMLRIQYLHYYSLVQFQCRRFSNYPLIKLAVVHKIETQQNILCFMKIMKAAIYSVVQNKSLHVICM